jgi:hypothetical protein
VRGGVARCGMSYRITIERIDEPKAAGEANLIVDVYRQIFDELDTNELITRINHKPRTRNRTAKKKEAAK